MKKSQQFLLVITAAFVLSACQAVGQSSAKTNFSSTDSSASSSSTSSANSTSSDSSDSSTSSSSSSASIDFSKETMSFGEAVTLLENMSEKETLSSSSVKVTKEETTQAIIDTSEETFTVKTDGSSFSEGTLSREENRQTTQSDTFARRYLEQTDKIKNGTVTGNFPMFYMITDYAKNNFTSSDYADSARKLFVVDSEAEATSQGLESGNYILSSDVATASTAQAINTFSTFFDKSILNNDYVTQLGNRKFTKAGETYSFSAQYSYDGDLNDTETFHITASFTLNEDHSTIASVSYQSINVDTNKSDATDSYTKSSSYKAVISYGTRSEAASPINVNDYFLSTISDFAICNSDSERSEADPKAFSLTNSYLFAKAKSFTPSKATNVMLSNISSSNSAVIALTSDGYFEVKGVGTTTLTFSYFGKDDANVYEEKNLTKDIIVVAPEATELNLFAISPAIVDNTLYLGTTYTMGTSVSPAKANQAIKVTSSDEKVLTAIAGTNNEDVTLAPVAEGTATVTVTSIANPKLTKTMTLTVKAAIADEKYLAKLTSTTYLYTNTTYNYTFALTFKTDGTGTRIQTLTESGKTYTDTFSYTLKGTGLTFTNWSDNAPHAYQTGLIGKEGAELTLDDSSSSMVTDTYEAQ